MPETIKESLSNLWEDHARKVSDIEVLSEKIDEHQNRLNMGCVSIKKLEDQVKQINGQKFSEFHHLTPRVERLESNHLAQQLDPKVWAFMHERLDKIESDLSSGDGLKEIWLAINEVRGKLSGLESFIDDSRKVLKDDLEKHFQWYESVEHRLDLVQNQQTRAYQPRRPHQCPNCRGCGRLYDDVLAILTQGEYPPETQLDHEGRRYKICISCEGEGIVWG